jgi:acyl-CoA synthetase (AMP-forming)/AMP-acid ligase II
VQLTWLPQYHDLGLVCGIIVPFAAGGKCNMFSPIEFIKNPLLWINLISRLNVTHSYAPNFAYRLAARKFIEAKAQSVVKGKEPISNLDLSSVLYLLNAAEPIQLDTKELFQNAFGSYGLPDDWFVAGYGLAESVVGVMELQEHKLSSFEPTEGQPSVAVGHTKFFPQGQIAKIVSPTTLQELGDREVGELWLSGPSITLGYFAKSDLTEQVFNAKLGDDNKLYLRTGDLAFFEEGYLYICGRQKDLIIVNGVNHYPQDIENTVQNASTAIRQGCIASIG